MFYTLVLQFYNKNGQKKKYDTFLRKKTEQKQNSATIMISVDEKGTAFQWSWNYKGNCLNKDVKKRILKKIQWN